MTEHQKLRIMKLRSAGFGYGKIAQQLGISVNTVKSFCRRQSLSKDTASKLAEILSGEAGLTGSAVLRGGDPLRELRGRYLPG